LRGRLAGEYPLLLEAAGHAEVGSDDWCGAQFWLGWTAGLSGDLPAALGLFTAMRDAAGHRPPSRALADALWGRTAMLRLMGQIPEGAAEARRLLAVGPELGYPAAEAQGLGELGLAALEDGDLDSAVQLTRQAEQISGEMPGPVARACSLVLTATLTAAGDLAAARRVCAAALAASREVGDLFHQLNFGGQMAVLDLEAGRTGDAAAHLHEALEIALRADMHGELFTVLDHCGLLCAQAGRPAEAVTLWAAIAAVMQHSGIPDAPSDERLRHEPQRQARQALDAAQARAAEERGAAMNLDTAAEYALMLTTPAPQVPAAETGAAKLSAREKELVILVAQGATDAQIAAQLYISVRTVSSHLDRIRDKTGCRRRADLTRLALTTGLI
jgi:DNA-binding CsgD family transcriptional regulator/tetratricopeptide (TPR) repeat protein